MKQREIKYRVWNKELKVFGYPARGENTNKNDKTFTLGDCYIIFQIGDGLDISHLQKEALDDIINNKNKFVIQQYTGLHDKNSKRIYEGDILHKKLRGGLVLKGKVFLGKSNMHNEEIETWCVKMGTDIFWIDTSVQEECEIIGNIYENPELLKSNK